MSIIIQPSTPGAPHARQAPLPVGPGGAVGAAAAGAAAGGGGDTVAFSPAAVLLALLQAEPAATAPALPAPGSAQAIALTTLLAQRMAVLLREAGLPAGSAAALEVDGEDRVRVVSNRPEVAQLQALVNAHPDVLVLARLLHAINVAPAAVTGAATQSALESRAARDEMVGPATAPVPPLFHPWGWLGMAPGPHTTHAPRLRTWLRWLAAAALTVLGLLLWQW